MRAFFPLLALSSVAQALYFYIDGTTPKCFYEELPKDTLVVGHYNAEEWDDHRQAWWKHDGLSIYISVDVRHPLKYSSQTRGQTRLPRPVACLTTRCLMR